MRRDKVYFYKRYPQWVLDLNLFARMQKILIVEDNPSIVEIVACALKRAGYHIASAGDGVSALLHIEHDKPDLVILDLGLPKLPGEEVCRAIRRNEKTRDLPIIMVTGKTRDCDKVLGKVIGANEYMTKPVDLDSLVKAVSGLLEETESSTESAPYQSSREFSA
jgi:DNA-binding response OmpR family regulator